MVRLLHFVRWPDGVFGTSTSPIRLGYVGAKPDESQIAILRAGRVRTRPIVVFAVEADQDKPDCHVLAIWAGVDPDRASSLIAALEDEPVLTVAHWAAPGARDAVVRFLGAGERRPFVLDEAAAKRAGLGFSSHVLEFVKREDS